MVAVRLSPDGSRIAIVVSGAKASSAQLYVGSIVRGSGQVRIDQMPPVSPEGVVVRDVAWLDSNKLFAIGKIAATGDPRVFTTGVDGSEWTNSDHRQPVARAGQRHHDRPGLGRVGVVGRVRVEAATAPSG